MCNGANSSKCFRSAAKTTGSKNALGSWASTSVLVPCKFGDFMGDVGREDDVNGVDDEEVEACDDMVDKMLYG